MTSWRCWHAARKLLLSASILAIISCAERTIASICSAWEMAIVSALS